jgi:large subunit ribosomal protein L29
MAKAALHKIGDIRQKTSDELAALLLQLRKEQFNIRFQRATGQTEGIGRIREARREIARIKTIQGQRASDAATAGPGQTKGEPATAGSQA